MVYKKWKSSTNDTHRSPSHWKLFSEDLEPRRGILSWSKGVPRYWEITRGGMGWWGRNFVTERQRRWKTWRKRQHGDVVICYNKEVVRGVARSDDVASLY
jgi:hypothetical protein